MVVFFFFFKDFLVLHQMIFPPEGQGALCDEGQGKNTA